MFSLAYFDWNFAPLGKMVSSRVTIIKSFITIILYVFNIDLRYFPTLLFSNDKPSFYQINHTSSSSRLYILFLLKQISPLDWTNYTLYLLQPRDSLSATAYTFLGLIIALMTHVFFPEANQKVNETVISRNRRKPIDRDQLTASTSCVFLFCMTGLITFCFSFNYM